MEAFEMTRTVMRYVGWSVHLSSGLRPVAGHPGHVLLVVEPSAADNTRIGENRKAVARTTEGLDDCACPARLKLAGEHRKLNWRLGPVAFERCAKHHRPSRTANHQLLIDKTRGRRSVGRAPALQAESSERCANRRLPRLQPTEIELLSARRIRIGVGGRASSSGIWTRRGLQVPKTFIWGH